MPKTMMILVVLFAAGICFVVYLVAKSLMGEPVTVEVEKPEKQLRNTPSAGEKAAARAKAVLDKTTNKFKKTASDAADALRGPVIKLTVVESPIVLKAGTPKEVKIRRANDAKLDALQLKLTPATDSKLNVKGGAFKKGERETTFIIEAATGGLDASLTIEIESDERARIMVPVRIK
jgi:hypothetical protein